MLTRASCSLRKFAHFHFGGGILPDQADVGWTIHLYKGSAVTIMIEKIMKSQSFR
jgi:hypothetical protein